MSTLATRKSQELDGSNIVMGSDLGTFATTSRNRSFERDRFVIFRSEAANKKDAQKQIERTATGHPHWMEMKIKHLMDSLIQFWVKRFADLFADLRCCIHQVIGCGEALCCGLLVVSFFLVRLFGAYMGISSASLLEIKRNEARLKMIR